VLSSNRWGAHAALSSRTARFHRSSRRRLPGPILRKQELRPAGTLDGHERTNRPGHWEGVVGRPRRNGMFGSGSQRSGWPRIVRLPRRRLCITDFVKNEGCGRMLSPLWVDVHPQRVLPFTGKPGRRDAGAASALCQLARVADGRSCRPGHWPLQLLHDGVGETFRDVGKGETQGQSLGLSATCPSLAGTQCS
jgi:hypothetical protein